MRSIFIAVLFVAAPAFADNKQIAKRYVDAGLAAQGASDYDTAVTFYTKAYELVPHPVLLFNMAQANRLAGRASIALDLYRRYVAAEPNGPQAKTARAHIARLKREVKERIVAPRPVEEEPAPKPVEQAKPTEPERLDEDPEQLPDDAPDPGRSWRITALVAGGAGLIAISVGASFGAKARALSNELSEPGAPFDPAKVAAGESAERLMIAGIAVGSALVIGGSVAYFVGRSKSRALAVAPLLVPDGGGVVVRGGF